MSDATFPESWPEDSMNHIPNRKYRRRQHDAARATYSDGRADRPTTEPRTPCDHLVVDRRVNWADDNSGGTVQDGWIWVCETCGRAFRLAPIVARATPPAAPLDDEEMAQNLAMALVEAGNPSQYRNVGDHAKAILAALRRHTAALTGGPSRSESWVADQIGEPTMYEDDPDDR